MENYWMTFRLGTNATYSQRYEALVDAIVEASGDGGRWGEPTSFWLFGSELGIDALVKKLSAKLSAKDDLLVIRCLARDDSRYFGTTEHIEILKGFLPKIKKA